MATYTAITKKRLRGETGSLSYKLATEFGLIATLLSGASATTNTLTITKATITLAAATKINLDGNTEIDGFFNMGAQGTGIAVTTANPYVMEVHAKTGSDLTAGASGLSCGLRCRYEVGYDQTNQISMIALEGRLRPKKDLGDGSHAGVSGTIEASEGAACVLGGISTTQRSAGNFCVELGENVTCTSGWLTGVTIDSSTHSGVSMASCTYAGLRIKTSSGKEVWEHGIYLDDASATTGITLGTCTTGIDIGACATGISFTGATTPTFITGTQNTTTTTATLEPAIDFAWTNDDIYGDDGDRILGSGSTMMGFLQIGSRATPTTIKNKGSHVGILIEQNLTGETTALNAVGDYVGGIYNVLSVDTTAQTTGMIAPITNYLRIYDGTGIDHSGNFIVSRNICYIGGDDEAYNVNVGHFALVDQADTHDSESACAGVEVVMNITTAKSSGDIDSIRLSVPGTQNVDSGIFFEDDDFDYAFRFGAQTSGANGEAPAGNPADPTTAVAGNQNGWIKVLIGTATRYIPVYTASA